MPRMHKKRYTYKAQIRINQTKPCPITGNCRGDDLDLDKAFDEVLALMKANKWVCVRLEVTEHMFGSTRTRYATYNEASGADQSNESVLVPEPKAEPFNIELMPELHPSNALYPKVCTYKAVGG